MNDPIFLTIPGLADDQDAIVSSPWKQLRILRFNNAINSLNLQEDD